MFTQLDTNKDGIITRTEFMFQWKIVAKQVLDTSKNADKGALACTIL